MTTMASAQNHRKRQDHSRRRRALDECDCLKNGGQQHSDSSLRGSPSSLSPLRSLDAADAPPAFQGPRPLLTTPRLMLFSPADMEVGRLPRITLTLTSVAPNPEAFRARLTLDPGLARRSSPQTMESTGRRGWQIARLSQKNCPNLTKNF